VRAIQVTETGGPEVLRAVELTAPRPAQGQVTIRVAAAGVNYIDTYHRTGLYPLGLPFVPGMEGAGVVVDAGEGVVGLEPGDLVAWADVMGSYAETVAAPAGRVVRVPKGVDAETAAAAMLQGMTAHYLAHDTFPLRPGHRCLVHAAAGGVGLLLVQLAKRAGATVFATAGSPEKAGLAAAAGADHVVEYRTAGFRESIEAIAGPHALDVVYDGVGRAVFDDSLELLRPRGTMVTFGNAGGPVDPVSPLRLMQGGSLFLTRPTLVHHIATRADLERRAGDLFEWIGAGELEVRIADRLPLDEAAEAHHRLESRSTSGKLLLIP
jgi:NADPH:quinone reductase